MNLKYGPALMIFPNTELKNLTACCEYPCLLDYKFDLPFVEYLLSCKSDHSFYESDQPEFFKPH